MKRRTALALAAVFSLSVAGTALAATANPFVDVPAKHWAYDSVSQLAQAGVISGYPDGTFKGDKTMTRYEMATVVAKVMANSEKLSAENKKALEALKAEFSAELNNLGVRVDNLEKKTDNVKINGEIRLMYENTKEDGASQVDRGEISEWVPTDFKGNPLTLRTRLLVSGQINNDWSYNTRFSNVKNMRHGANDSDAAFDYANISGPVGGGALKVGRIDVMPAYGVVFDDTINGAVYSFGNKLKVDLVYGKHNGRTVNDYPYHEDSDTLGDMKIGAVNLATSIGKVNVKGAYFQADDVNADLVGKDKVKIWEAGFDTNVAPDLKLTGAYAKSDVDDQSKAFMLQLNYKGADTKEPGSYGAWVGYRKLEAASYLVYTFDHANVNWHRAYDSYDDNNNQDIHNLADGGKGYEVGFNYVPFKNGKWTTTYTDLKGTVDTTIKGKYFLTKMEVFF